MEPYVDPEIWHGYCFYVAILLFKMILIALITGFIRLLKKAYLNPEDAKLARVGDPHKNALVERIRRSHRNDLENIIPFCILAFAFLSFTDPTYYNALIHFRVFVGARVLHTVFYIFAVPQPTRFLAFFVAVAVNISFCVQIWMVGHAF